MDREGNYLQIPPVYELWLEGLRWAWNGEALEYADGQTFVLSPQLALFLEGFAEQAGLPNFGNVLHLMHLLGYGRVQRPALAQELAAIFARTGRPLRNAGALCAHLCKRFPTAAGTLDTRQVCGLLWNSALLADLICRWHSNTHVAPEAPAFGPSQFEEQFLKRLEALPREEWEHWFRHGCGQVGEAPKQLAREIVPEKTRSVSDILEALARRERLADALPYVSQLVSALALPPRKLERQELPVGGYADVTTRGLPERLLPSQFALDDLDFVRRFAENELLYFRREEPTRHLREELVVLLDQGVRTWGVVRLVLSAAMLAFGKLAARRKIAWRVACTSKQGVALDPLGVDDETVGRLLETSDLSPHPGLALERVLEEPAEVARDVVLLTHPRSLVEADVQGAARRASAPTRLFALAVNTRGRVELAEVRHGTALPVRQFQVDIIQPAAPKQKPSRDPRAWSGDVEPIPFPFRFGIGNASPLVFDFDEGGEWLLVASNNGMLHAFKLDGSELEVLPRGMIGREVLTEVERVRGVVGGFAVCGRVGKRLCVVHYEFGARRCTAHTLLEDLREIETPTIKAATWQWYYFPELHSVVADGRLWSNGTSGQPKAVAHRRFGVDLTTGCYYPARSGGPGRAQVACETADQYSLPPPELPLMYGTHAGHPKPHLCQDTYGGMLSLSFMPSRTISPTDEGKPVIHNHTATRACWRNDVLAVAMRETKASSKQESLWLFRANEENFVNRFPNLAPDAKFTLSLDGRLLARQVGQVEVEVREVGSGSLVFTSLKGKSHQRLQVRLGPQFFHATVGRWHHFVRWAAPHLEVFCIEGTDDPIRHYPSQFGLPVAAQKNDIPVAARYDISRFVAGATMELSVAVDAFGQIAVFDRAGQLLCMFFVFRNQFAGWMPDGLRFGPENLIGGKELATARHCFAQVLREASAAEVHA